jgi:hypothetical protein
MSIYLPVEEAIKRLREQKSAVAVMRASSEQDDGAYRLVGCEVSNAEVSVGDTKYDRKGIVLMSSRHVIDGLAAFRTWYGFWVVIDTRISGALNAVDSALEDEA